MTGDAPAGAPYEERLRALEDRAEIVGLLHAYCRFVDLLATSELAGLFSKDCLVDYGPGLGGPLQGRAVLERALGAGLQRFAATSHHLTNAEIALEGDSASGVSSVLAWHRLTDDAPDAAWLFGQYHDRFVREHGRWWIAERRLLVAGESGFNVAWNLIERRSRPAPTGEYTGDPPLIGPG